MNKIIGMILPLTVKMFNNLQEKKGFSLIKFTPNGSIPKFLKKKDKILLYYSGKIVGEGILDNLISILPKEVQKKELLISSDELKDYIGKRENKKVIYFKISNFKVYKKQKEDLFFPVPPSGRYMTEKEYSSI